MIFLFPVEEGSGKKRFLNIYYFFTEVEHYAGYTGALLKEIAAGIEKRDSKSAEALVQETV